MRIEGNRQESDRLIKDYVLRYPESETASALKIEELMETDPAKAKLLAKEAQVKFPKSSELAFDLARILHGEGKLSEAEQWFVKAAELAPDSAGVHAWTGRFFFKVRNNKPRALDFYLDAYFLDPHAYETEFVESRIRNISGELAKAEMEKQIKNGTPLERLLDDPNPAIVAIALDQMAASWKATYLESVLKCLAHDDGGVRWLATEAIKKNVNRTFDPKLKALLTDSDLRQRGLAAYLAVHLWQKESFPIIQRMLTEESQLLRFDAVSALILEGGEAGRRIAFDHAASERNPTLRKMIEMAKQQPKN